MSIYSERKNFRHCAVITGAGSGIGKAFALQLAAAGFYIVLTGRNEKALEEVRKKIGDDGCTVIVCDLSDTKACIDLYAESVKLSPDLLINNAGFGLYGEFISTSLSKELEMIDVNIKAVHILFKLFTKYFVKCGRGYVLNVASSAGLLPGPLMSTYYSTKGYVVRQTQAVYEELRRNKSKVHVAVLCPGPVSTDFNARAGIKGFMKGITAEECAEYALKKLFEGKLMIIPTFKIQLTSAAVKLAPDNLVARASYYLQNKKTVL